MRAGPWRLLWHGRGMFAEKKTAKWQRRQQGVKREESSAFADLYFKREQTEYYIAEAPRLACNYLENDKLMPLG